LNNEELHNLYLSPNIIRMTKSRRIRWAGHVAWERRGMHTVLWWKYLKEKDNYKDLNIDGTIISKRILEK
jgi:hypothetical protein